MASVRGVNTHVKDARKRSSFSSPAPLFVAHWHWGLPFGRSPSGFARRCFCTETNLVRRVREHPVC